MESRQTHEIIAGFTLSHDLFHEMSHEWSANLLYRQQDVDNPGVQSSQAIFEIPPTIFTTRFSRYRLGSTVRAHLGESLDVAGGWQIIVEKGERVGIQTLTALGLPDDISSTFHSTRTTTAGFVESSFSPFSRITLSLGTRINSPKDFPITVNPRLGLIIHATPSTTLRGNFGKGFKLPSFNALSDPLTGNASLQPETSQSWDLGLQYSIWASQLSLEFTYFHNRFNNLIDLDPALANQGTFTLVNLNSVVTQGIELAVIAIPHASITMKGSMTYTQSDVLGSGTVLRNRPRLVGSGVIEYHPISGFLIRGYLRGVTARTDFQVPTRETIVPGFVRADISAIYEVTSSWSIVSVIENLWNAAYQEYAGFPAPGVWVRFGLSYLQEG